MRGIDEIDIQILRLLNEDARRPYSDIAELIDVSQPTVSNRVERLRELGVIRGFSLNLDRSILHDGVAVLVELETCADTVAGVARALQGVDAVHKVYTTADSHVLAVAVCRPEHVHELVSQTTPDTATIDYEVKLLTDTETDPSIHDVEFNIECVTCGNRVISENGVSSRIDGTIYHFCCGRCEDDFTQKHERLRQNAGV